MSSFLGESALDGKVWLNWADLGLKLSESEIEGDEVDILKSKNQQTMQWKQANKYTKWSIVACLFEYLFKN